MACLTDKAAIMGSGPGEVWLGPDEMKVAYEHFFEVRLEGSSNVFKTSLVIGLIKLLRFSRTV
jgi:hypothetical protein